MPAQQTAQSVTHAMGKAKHSQTFFEGEQGAGDTSRPSPIKNVPAMIALVVVGVGLVLFLRSRPKTSTGPALTVLSDPSADSSGVLNLANSLVAVGQVHNPNPSAPTVGGGVSTPIVAAG